jgi:outer membrane protein OmpA-like peptidoglycan-associated protein
MKTIRSMFYLGTVLLLSLTLFCTSPQKVDEKADETTPAEDKTKEEKAKEVKDRASENTKDGKESPDGKESSDGKESPDDGREASNDDGKESSDGKEESYEDLQGFVDSLNLKLEGLRYPDGKKVEGFQYKSSSIPNSNHFAVWLKANNSVIKKAFTLPQNYSLEITGHSDSSGPEEAESGKKGNIYYSEQRAISVKNALIKAGFPGTKIVTKGVGSQQTLSGLDGRDAKNRRVTFRIVSSQLGE